MNTRTLKNSFGRIRLVQIAAMAMVVSSCRSADDYPVAKIQQACKQNSVAVFGQASTKSLYVDRSYLRILVKPFDETYSLDDVVAFMLTNGYSAIDTPNRDRDGNDLVYGGAVRQETDLIRVSVKQMGDPACDRFDYSKQYPAQAWPWLRRMGIQPNECIGVEAISNDERSAVRILVDELVLSTQLKGLWWQSRLDVRVVDASQAPEHVFARMTEHYGGSGGGNAGYQHAFLCEGGDRQTRVFAQAFRSAGNRAKAPALLEAPTESGLSVDQVSDDELRSLNWIARPQKVWSTNIINPEGTVWISWTPSGNDYSHSFQTFLGDRIISTRISLPEKGLQDVTGLAKSRLGWAVIAAMNINKPDSTRYLVEIDQMGRLIRIAKLSEGQYATLSN